jgi:hypothetical protein
MKIFPAVPFCILAQLACAIGRPSPRPDPETDFLRLRNGSLVESIHFRSAWLKEHPTEDAIIILKETRRDGQIHVEAICAYTNRRTVYLHGDDCGTVFLPGARPDILNQGPAALAAYDNVLAAHRRIGANPAQPPIGDDEAQIQRAFAVLHDSDIMGFFPVAVSKLRPMVSGMDGAETRESVDWLVFDWNGGHYAYRPGVGAIRLQVPVDPLTDSPYLCVALGDLVESVIFCAEYRRAHPDESAVVLYDPHRADRGENTGGTAAAAFTRNGFLYIHSLFFGNIDLNENGRLFVPKDLADPSRIYRAYESYLWNRYVAACGERGVAAPDPRSLHRGGTEIIGLLGTREPEELPGDTPELQVRRAFQRAQALGLSSEVATEALPDEPALRTTCLVLCWNVSEYVYAPSLGGRYGVETDAATLPNRLIDGILFASRYRRDHPGENALAIPYRETGTGKWKAVTVYAKDGSVWLHNTETGETPFEAFAPRDLENPAIYKYIREAGNKLIKEEAIRRIRGKSARLNGLSLNRTVDASALEPHAVFVQLAAQKISCRLLPSTRERDAAGRFREFPSPSLTFQWWGVTYTYGPGHTCTASDGFVSTP